MTTVLLVIALIIIFLIGLVSPHLAGKIQRKTDKEAHWLNRLSDWCWNPVTWWAKESINWSRKAIDWTAGLGKKEHKKIKRGK